MTQVETPLGVFEVLTVETTLETFLIGELYGLPLSILVDTPPNATSIDVEFIDATMRDYDKFHAAAEDYLRALMLKSPSLFRLTSDTSITGALLEFPEFLFDQTKEWNIVFRKSPLPIAHPYGILINYDNDTVTGFEDLSEAEEL